MKIGLWVAFGLLLAAGVVVTVMGYSRDAYNTEQGMECLCVAKDGRETLRTGWEWEGIYWSWRDPCEDGGEEAQRCRETSRSYPIDDIKLARIVGPILLGLSVVPFVILLAFFRRS